MDRKFNRNLQIGYGFSIAMLLLVGVVSYKTVVSLLDSNHSMSRSAMVIQKLEKALSLMKDAETGQRGYLLTGRKEFLTPYNGAPREALKLVDEAQKHTTDNADQQRNIGHVRDVMVQRMSILQAMIEKRDRGDVMNDNDFYAGKAAMDELRTAVDRAEKAEQALLKERTGRFQTFTTLTPIFIIVALAVAMIIAVVSYFRVMADVREKDRLNNDLLLQQQETAAINEELTAANEEISAGNEELIAINEELVEAREELQSLNDSLEQKVAERTRALADSEEDTQALNEELTAMNEELLSTNEALADSKRVIEKSEKLFSTIAGNIPGSLILVVDKDHKLLAAEGDLLERFGFQENNLVGKVVKDVSPPERYEASKPLYDRMFTGEQIRVERKDYDGYDYQVDFVPLFDDDNEVYAGLVIAQDISDMKGAEERSAKLASIVESSDDAILSKSLEGIITSWNRGAQRMFGYTEAEMVGQSILKLIPEERQDEEPVILSKLRNGERVDHFETKRLTSDGRQIDVSLTISPIHDASGAVIGISKIARDISEQKLDEQRKNDFIGMASHELKTPLTSLSALIQVLNMKLHNNEDAFVPSALEKANTQVRKMSSMINGFLNISRLESGKLQIEKRPFELNALIDEMIGEIKLTVASHTFVFEPQGDLKVDADPDKIGSVISNLLSNAVKYSPKGKLVTVSAEVIGNEVQVSVKDEGMGIKPNDMPHLFDRYYRVNSEHTRNISGFGIGLYLSAEIIHRHDGRIWAESEKGVGSTFYFTLPL
ncbi:PAS domain S-box protein [Mucilaginibacter mali]|uniref:histidine kinase n=1 Tax=Mucilaginibacter mali TaxID=2740462 RepID=A0A7D4UKR0_9SPHI|nr:PAS domain S-box protein [Mucilaginibacter mali]QKJ31022.1 PAS domain S-box protein [Mucilaginibacter mali]